MSRVGKKPIPLPKGVKLQIGKDSLHVEGPKGKLTVPVPAGIRIEQKDTTVEVLRDTDKHAALHGLTRALASNAMARVNPCSAACLSVSRNTTTVVSFCSMRIPAGTGTVSLPFGPSTWRESLPIWSFTPFGNGIGFFPTRDIFFIPLPDL